MAELLFSTTFGKTLNGLYCQSLEWTPRIYWLQ